LEFNPVKPNFIGVTQVEPKIADLVDYIDWTPFFRTWDLHGRYPYIFKDEVVGEQAKTLFDDAQKMLSQIISENWLVAKGVYGIFPANTVNDDDIEIYEATGNLSAKFLTLRQQTKKTKAAPNLALADFIAPKDSGIQDYVGVFCVTTGFGVDEKAVEFEKAHDDYNSIMVKALG